MRDKIAMVMVTTDRSLKNRKNYVLDTLNQLEAAGVFSSPYYHSLTIHVDRSSPKFANSIKESLKYHDSVTVREYTESAGSAGNALRAHKEAFRTDADWTMMLEDDLQIADEFLESVMSWIANAYDTNRLVYQLGVWTEYVDHYKHNGTDAWFDFYGHNEPKEKIFTLERPTELMRGSQCYLMCREYSKKFADFINAMMIEKKVEHLIHHDMRIRQWLNAVAYESGNNDIGLLRSPIPFSFVQHVGVESSVYDVKKHIDPAFYFKAQRNKEPMMKKHRENGAFELEYQKVRYNSYISKSLCKLLAETLPKDNPVYDMGCGTGEYLEYLDKEGFEVIGFDGTPGIADFAKVKVIEQDLTEPMEAPKRKGSVLCIEVAEHIPEDKAGVLLDNINAFADDLVVLSWAIPGQGGVGHVNERPNTFVINKMRKRGFVLIEDITKKWREETGKDLQWFANTIMVFRRIQV